MKKEAIKKEKTIWNVFFEQGKFYTCFSLFIGILSLAAKGIFWKPFIICESCFLGVVAIAIIGMGVLSVIDLFFKPKNALK